MGNSAGSQRYQASPQRLEIEIRPSIVVVPAFGPRSKTPTSFQVLSPQRYSGEAGRAALLTSPAVLTFCRSRRSVRVSCLPHPHSKLMLSEHHTESGPPSTVCSLQSSQTSMTFLEEPFICQPPSSDLAADRQLGTPERLVQHQPPSSRRKLRFTCAP
jgi:hypothetical protein